MSLNTAALPIFEAAALVVVAPLCGVWLGAHRLRGIAPTMAVFGSVLVASATWTLFSAGASPQIVSRVLTSHAALTAVGLALAAVGTLCGSRFQDPLDAAAVSLVVALTASLGLFATGRLGADLPTGIVDSGLAASPIVAVAAAADFDILRTDWMYRVSPLAHGRFDYPAWYSTLLSFGAVLLVCAAATARSLYAGTSASRSQATPAAPQ